MTNKYVKSIAAVIALVAIMATPVMGAVCTMSCGDSGSCCCQGGPSDGQAYLSAPGCCEGEYRPSARVDAMADRTANTFHNQTAVIGFGQTVDYFVADSGSGTDDFFSVRYLRPPPLPLFILNASFLI